MVVAVNSGRVVAVDGAAVGHGCTLAHALPAVNGGVHNKMRPGFFDGKGQSRAVCSHRGIIRVCKNHWKM